MRRRPLIAAAIGAVLLAGIIAGAPMLLDTDAARRAVEQRVSAVAGESLRYDSLAAHLFPSPRIEMRGIAVRVPGVIDGRIATAEVRFAWFPLLAGNFRPSHVRLTEPVLELRFTLPVDKSDPFAAYRAALGPVVAALVRGASGMTVSIRGGRVEVMSAGQRVAALSDLAAAASVSAKAIEASASCAADLWQKAQGRARIDTGSLAASANFKLTGWRIAEATGGIAVGADWRLRPAAVDATIDIETDAIRTMRVATTAATPQFVLARGAREKELGAARAAGEMVQEGGAVTTTLRNFDVGELLHGGSVVLRAGGSGTATTFELKAALLDVGRLRAAMAFVDDRGAPPGPFAYIQAGVLRELAASGALPAADAGAMRAEARIEGAAVAVPAAGIVVRNGSGHFALAGGILRGRELAGDIGRSTFSAGDLELGLERGTRLRSLGAGLRADLGDVLTIARRIAAGREVAGISGIEAIAGRATGSIRYDAGRSAAPLVLALANLEATGRHHDVPLPFAVTSGNLRYSGAALQVQGLAGSVGRSRVSDASIDLELGPETAIRSASGDAELVLEEVLPWLNSIEVLRPRLESVTKLTGGARVHLARLAGPVSRPAALDFEAVITPRHVSVETPSLYAPLILASGTLAINARTLKLAQLALSAGDTHVTVAGSVVNYADAAPQSDIELAQGAIGGRAIDWVRTRFRLPADAVPRAPLEIRAAHLRWRDLERDPLTAQGKVRVGGSVDAEFDLVRQPGDLNLSRLALKDADTNLSASLHWKPGAADLSLDGVLDRRTFARMLAHPPAGPASLRGKFRATVDVHEPPRSSADGKLEGEGLDLMHWFGIPLALERFRLEANDRVLRVLEGGIAVAGQRMDVTGSIGSRQGAWVIDGRLTAKTLNIERLTDSVTRAAGTEQPAQRASSASWDLPFSGRVEIAAESLAWRTHVLQQVAGSLELAPDRVVVTATDARYCGASAPFTAVLTPGRIEAKAQFRARGQSVAQTLPCLTPDAPAVSGTYDLDADLTASGAPEALRDNARGTFRLAMREGRIVHSTVLERTLTVEEVARRMQDKTPLQKSEGMDYKQITLAGSVGAGRAHFDPSVIDSASLYLTISGDVTFADGGLDVQGLVAPLQSGPGRLLGKSLVVVPVSIRGTVRDPKVSVLPAAAVGKTLLNLVTARFLLPVNLFDISGGGSKSNRSTDGDAK